MVDLYGFWGDGYVVSWINYIIVVSPLPLTKSGWATDFIGINWVCLTPPTHNAL